MVTPAIYKNNFQALRNVPTEGRVKPHTPTQGVFGNFPIGAVQMSCDHFSGREGGSQMITNSHKGGGGSGRGKNMITLNSKCDHFRGGRPEGGSQMITLDHRRGGGGLKEAKT